MKYLLSAAATCLCALALLVSVPSTGFAGGGHGYRHHHGKHHYGHRRHYGHRHHRRHGFFFGFSSHGYRPYYGHGYGYPGYYRQPRVIYRQPPVQYVQPDPVYVAPPPAQQQQTPNQSQFSGGCQMIREYQTQVTVGGKLVDAYGDACLKPDGSWERGPHKVVQY